MTLEVLMSTMGMDPNSSLPEGIKDLHKESIDCLLINQVENHKDAFEKNEQHLRILSYPEKGLSRSRNRAIQNAHGDIVLLADDDIRYLNGIEKTILGEFQKHEHADIICFQLLKKKGHPYKRYGTATKHINRFDSLRVSSAEIAIRLTSIKKKGVIFDEHFGLGTSLPSGEEQVFLKDALDSDLHVIYVPIPIALHEAASSGETGWTDKEYRQSKGALLYRLFGGFSTIMMPLFALKKSHLASVSWLQLTRDMFKGRRIFKSNQ